MLHHAYQEKYDAAVPMAADEDYEPLVRAAKDTGRRVFLWFVDNALSSALTRLADYYCDAGAVLCDPTVGHYFD